jgi:uncharacterized protein YkwD
MRAASWIGVLAGVVGLPAPSPPPAATALERQVVAEMSLARTQPRLYATYLHRLRGHYDRDLYREPGRPALRTFEGVRALEEAIAFLEAATPAGPLAWNEALFRAARDHAADQGRSGATGHAGADGSTLRGRVERHGTWLGPIAENIQYGVGEARPIVIALLVDDGVASRGHRRNIFDPKLKVAGAALALHPAHRHVCVIDFAGGMEPEAAGP